MKGCISREPTYLAVITTIREALVAILAQKDCRADIHDMALKGLKILDQEKAK